MFTNLRRKFFVDVPYYRSIKEEKYQMRNMKIRTIDSLEIRNYKPCDLDACRSLYRELTDRHGELYNDPTIGGEHPEDYFNKHLKEVGKNRVWVAVVDSKVVGFTSLILREENGEIEPIVVNKQYRSKGIGRSLIKTVIAEAKKLGIKGLSIQPVARNLRALKLFYKLGFTNLGQIEMFMDFSDKKWQPGQTLFNLEFNY